MKRLNKMQLNIVFLFIGILFGLLVKNIFSSDISLFISDQICDTVVNIFFNLLKMMIIPIVFCSIALSVSEYDDIKQLGKIGIKTVLYFIIFSIMGILVGYLVFELIPCGSSKLLDMINIDNLKPSDTSTAVSIWDNLKSFIISIFPSNIMNAWINNEVLAFICIGSLFGIAANKLDKKDTDKINSVLNTLNKLIIKATSMIMSIMPIVIFCSMCKIAINLDLSTAKDLLIYLMDLIIGFGVMFIIFTITLLINKISPKKFYKDFGPTLFTAFSIASSSAVIPTSLKCCDDTKISKKISNFVIPLGSTINMNGSCVVLIVSVLFIARCFEVNISINTLILLCFMILLFSIASPGIPGSQIIMLASLLAILNIPAESTNLIIGVSMLVGMFMVPVNCIGDCLVAVLLNKKED